MSANLGLGTLDELKAMLLNASLLAPATYDTPISAIGKGVAQRMEKFCNRKFGWMAGDIFYCTSNREHVILPRYPVVNVSLIEQRGAETDTWTTLTDIVQSSDYNAGLIEFLAMQGPYYSRLRLTYDGGYWFNDGTSQPAGAATRPDDLLLAWFLQCEYVWRSRDKLGISLQDDPEKPLVNLRMLDFMPAVKEILRAYVRYSFVTG